MDDFSIDKAFTSVGVKSDDIVMVHADAGVAGQYRELSANKRLDYLINQIKAYFRPKGTVLVPSFSYSFTKNENFHVDSTPSDVGLFSERFRQGKDVKRSSHPIFSVCAWGKSADDFLVGTKFDCFGPSTFFEMLFKRNVKLVALGCSINSITFVHYVEQKSCVSYRYFKSFGGKVIIGGQILDVNTRYFVRNRKLNTDCNLILLSKLATKRKMLSTGSAGRFPIAAIGAVDFFDVATELLDKNEYSLISEGVVNDEI